MSVRHLKAVPERNPEDGEVTEEVDELAEARAFATAYSRTDLYENVGEAVIGLIADLMHVFDELGADEGGRPDESRPGAWAAYTAGNWYASDNEVAAVLDALEAAKERDDG